MATSNAVQVNVGGHQRYGLSTKGLDQFPLGLNQLLACLAGGLCHPTGVVNNATALPGDRLILLGLTVELCLAIFCSRSSGGLLLAWARGTTIRVVHRHRIFCFSMPAPKSEDDSLRNGFHSLSKPMFSEESDRDGYEDAGEDDGVGHGCSFE